jgi:ribosomal protein S3
MGQKVNPHGIRVGVIKDWDSRWFVSDEKFGDTLVSDYKVRTFLKKELQKQVSQRSRSKETTTKEFVLFSTAQSPVSLSVRAA